MNDKQGTTTRQEPMPIGRNRLWQLGMLVAAVLPLWFTLAIFRDVWIDELWTLYMSAHGLPFGEMFRERWTHDTHPPLFMMSQWLFGTPIGENLIGRRLLNLVPLLLFSGMAMAVARRRGDAMPFFLVFGALVFSSSVLGLNFPELRAYFGQYCASAVLAILLFELTHRDDDLQPGRDTGLAIMIVGTLLLALNLQYVCAFICGIVVGIFAIDQWRVGHRRWATLLVGTTAVCVGLLFLALWASRPYMAQATTDFWLKRTTGEGIHVLAKMMLLATSYNVVAVACGVNGLVAAWHDRRHVLARPDLRYVLLLAVALAIAAAALLAVNAVKPIMIERYVLPLAPFAAAGLATLAAKPAMRRGVYPLIVALAAVAIIPVLLRELRRQDWNAGAAVVSAQVRGCAGTRVYGVDRRDLLPAFAGAPLPNQHDIVSWSMQYVARQHDYALTMVRPDTGPLQLAPAPCPTIIWVDHEVVPVDVPAMVRHLSLGPAAAAGAHVVQLPNSMVLVIPPIGPAGAR